MDENHHSSRSIWWISLNPRFLGALVLVVHYEQRVPAPERSLSVRELTVATPVRRLRRLRRSRPAGRSPEREPRGPGEGRTAPARRTHLRAPPPRPTSRRAGPGSRRGPRPRGRRGRGRATGSSASATGRRSPGGATAGSARRLRGPRGETISAWCPRGRCPTARRARESTSVIASTPNSVSFCTTSSGRSPFVNTNAIVTRARAEVRARSRRSGAQRHTPPAPSSTVYARHRP